MRTKATVRFNTLKAADIQPLVRELLARNKELFDLQNIEAGKSWLNPCALPLSVVRAFQRDSSRIGEAVSESADRVRATCRAIERMMATSTTWDSAEWSDFDRMLDRLLATTDEGPVAEAAKLDTVQRVRHAVQSAWKSAFPVAASVVQEWQVRRNGPIGDSDLAADPMELLRALRPTSGTRVPSQDTSELDERVAAALGTVVVSSPGLIAAIERFGVFFDRVVGQSRLGAVPSDVSVLLSKIKVSVPAQVESKTPSSFRIFQFAGTCGRLDYLVRMVISNIVFEGISYMARAPTAGELKRVQSDWPFRLQAKSLVLPVWLGNLLDIVWLPALVVFIWTRLAADLQRSRQIGWTGGFWYFVLVATTLTRLLFAVDRSGVVLIFSIAVIAPVAGALVLAKSSEGATRVVLWTLVFEMLMVAVVMSS